MTEPSERPAIENLRGKFTSPDLQQRLKALSDCLKFDQGLDLLAQQALINPSEQVKQSAYWVLYGDNPYLTENVNLRSPNNLVQDTISCVAISSEYKIIVGGGWKTIRIWNLETGKLINTLDTHSHWVLSVAISSNGQYLVSGSIDKTVKLWNLKTKINVHTFTGHTSWVNVVKITPDNQTLISGSADKTIKLWNLEKKELVHTFNGHTGWITSLAISSDSKFLVSGSTDKTIKVWNLTQKQLLRTLEEHSDWIQNVAISSDDQSLVTGSRDGTIKIWQKDPKTQGKNENFNIPFVTDVLSFFFGKSNNQSPFQLLVNSLKCVKTITGKFQTMTNFDITPNGNIQVIGTNNGSIYIQNPNQYPNQSRKITVHTGFIGSIAVSSNSKLFVSGSRDWIKLWDLQKGEILNVLEGESPKLTSLKINSPGKTLYCGDYQEFTIQGFDQYNKPIKIENITWTATGGEVEDGIFQAGNISGSNFKIQAQVNSVSCQSSVKILEKPKLRSLKINPPGKTLYCGYSERFSAEGFDQYNQPFSIGQVRWTATGGTIENGLFKAGNISGYNFQIQAQVNSVNCQISITILEKPKLTSLKINPSGQTLYCGDSQQFSAEGFDQYNQPISIEQVTWTADNIELPNNGRFVAGDFEKTVTITAKVETISQSVQVEVIEFPRLTSLSISPSLIEMCPGQSHQFTVQGLDQRGNTISIKNINWTATGGTIDDKGNYTVGDNSQGQFTVTASIPGQTISATAKIIVPSILTDLIISPQTISAEPNEPITFQVMGLDQIGDWFWVNDIEWKCTAGGQIDREGVFKGGYEKYQVTVTAKVSLLQVSATVNILPVLRQIQINPHQDISLKPKEIITFNVVGFDQYGNEIETGNIVWEATGGTIDQNGEFTANDNDKGLYKVTAKVSPLSPYDMRSKILALGIYTKLISRSIYWTERLSSLSDKIRSVLFPNSAETEIQDQSETTNNISTASEQNSSSELSNFEIDLQAWVIKQAIKITVRLLDWVGDSCINFAQISDSVKIQVVPVLRSLKINREQFEINSDQDFQFHVTGFDQQGDFIKTNYIAWEATGGTINQNGYFVPSEDAEGSYEVSATAIPENISDLAEFKVIPVPQIKDVYVSSDFRDINSDQPLFISEVIEKVSDTIEDVREKLDNSFNATNRETAVEYSDNQLLNKKSYSDFKSKENFDHDSDSDSEYNEDSDNDSETNEDSCTEFYSPPYRIKGSLSYKDHWFYRSQLFYDGYSINDVETYADYLVYQDLCSFYQYDQD
ncbi:beta-propeller domain-containing protein [Planktothrix rubescens]|uniref:beta-propeller domain-containing protein n=1 Tax=Planktothrix rubescens TaxID=59512 RepID=UPI0003FB7174|nr:WD40 repeat domain-containing protein [Planktothrix rubescens]